MLQLLYFINCSININLGKNNLLILGCGLLSISGIKDLGLVAGDRGGGGVAVVTDLLGDPLAHSDGALLVHGVTLLHRPLAALLQGLVTAHLVRDLATSLSWHISTLLLGDITTHRVGHLPRLLFGHIPALVMGVGLAGAGDGDPHLVVALALPPVLAVFLVLGAALSLSVGLILRLVLVHTHLLVHCVALLLIHGLAHLSGCWLALSLKHCLALGHILSDTLLGLPLHILGVPHGGVLSPALHPSSLPGGDRGRGLNSAIKSGGGYS